MTLPCWTNAYGGVKNTGIIRQNLEDFKVDEIPAFECSGEGEHAFIHIEKRGENTDYIARQLARFAGVRQRDVSYAGLKDRHAVTTQWFSVWLPGKPDPDWSVLNSDNLKILQTQRHSRKLKRGSLAGNQFSLIIRDWSGDKAYLEQQLQQIKLGGVPNYFGAQRFGREGNNINKVLALFSGQEKIPKDKRGLFLSAARSYIFNEIVSARVQQGNWNEFITGDVMMFNDSHSFFKTDSENTGIEKRLNDLDIHPTAILFGKGELESAQDMAVLEQKIIEQQNELAKGLIAFGLEQDRRAIRCQVKDLQWQFIAEQSVALQFSLNAGCYATAVLKELFEMD